MEQLGKSNTTRFVAGALLTVTLLVSGYLLGLTQLPTVPEAEDDSAETMEITKLFEQNTENLKQEIARLKEQIQRQDLLLESILSQLQMPLEQPEQPQEQSDTREVPLHVVPQIITRHDTIWTIAARFQYPPTSEFINQIIELNGVDPRKLQIGQEILIPLGEME